jgi:CheY-like chemotaxis protein
MDRWQQDRVARPGRRHGDRRTSTADSRRVLLVGPDEAWRLVTAYVFEEAGYAVYAAAEQRQTVAFTTRLLPDVVVVQVETPDTLDILARLAAGSSTHDIPVVVLTLSLQSTSARRAREAGGMTLLAHSAEVDVMVGEVATLTAAAPRAQRTLKRRLLDIKELARYSTPDGEGQARLRHLIDRLQVAILAVDEPRHGIRSEPRGDDAHGLLRSAAADHLGVPTECRGCAQDASKRHRRLRTSLRPLALALDRFIEVHAERAPQRRQIRTAGCEDSLGVRFAPEGAEQVLPRDIRVPSRD